MAEIDELVSQLRALPGDLIDRQLSMSVLLSGGDEPIQVGTTFGRELAYTLTHTIHHNALVAAMVKTLGGWLPERFGYAALDRQTPESTMCTMSVIRLPGDVLRVAFNRDEQLSRPPCSRVESHSAIESCSFRSIHGHWGRGLQ